MNVIIKAKNLEMTSSLKEFIEERIFSLEKYSNIFQKEENELKAEIEAIVEVGRSTLHHKKGPIFSAQCQIIFRDKTFRAECESDDLEKAVNSVREDLKRQITAFKEKIINASRK